MPIFRGVGTNSKFSCYSASLSQTQVNAAEGDITKVVFFRIEWKHKMKASLLVVK
jgi:hypothetical protein